MLVKRVSPLTGKTGELDLPITQDQMDRWKRREGLIQNIMPNLDADQREFLMSGCMPGEFEKIFPQEAE